MPITQLIYKTIIYSMITMMMTGCTYYQTVPGSSSYTPQSKYDQSWSAATGAIADQGVHITSQDKGAGFVKGSLNGTTVTGSIRTQANGSVRVQFDTSGDSALIKRITDSYNRRMGR